MRCIPLAVSIVCAVLFGALGATLLMPCPATAATLEERVDILEDIECPGETPCGTPDAVDPDPDPAPDGVPACIAALAPGSGGVCGRPWAEAAPAVRPCGKPIEEIMKAWNGWARDGLNSVWIAASGGHSNGCDNGVYRYDIQNGTVELYEPHLNLNTDLGTGYPYVADANGVQIRPRSSHTKQGVIYAAPYIYVVTGSVWTQGFADAQSWRYHTVNKTWERLDDRRYPGTGGGNNTGAMIGDTGAFLVEVGNGDVWLFGWQSNGAVACLTDLAAGVFDCDGHNPIPKLKFGNKSGFAYDPQLDGIWHYDVQSGGQLLDFLRYDGVKWVRDAALSSAAAPTELSSYAGICVVPDGAGGSKPILWGEGANLHQWDPTAQTWTTLSPAGWPGANTKRRVLSKWSWDEASQTCIGGWHVSEGLRIYRPFDQAAVIPPPESDASFAARCADPAVILCDPLDSGRVAGVGIDANTPQATLPEALAARYGNWRRVLIKAGQPPPAMDTGVKASGDGSLRFTLPAQASSSGAGAFQTNFTPDGSVQFGEQGGTFYVQWRYRVSCSLLFTDCDPASPAYRRERVNFPTPKIAIVNDGDGPEAPGNINQIASSCSLHEIVFTAILHDPSRRGIPRGYHNCGWFEPFVEQKEINGRRLWDQQPGGVNQCWKRDPATGQRLTAAWKECRLVWADEWMTFEMAVTVGSWSTNSLGPPADSRVRLWVARQGGKPELIIDHAFNISAPERGQPWRQYGKVWLTPYMTGRSPDDAWPAGAIWYDELIVSREWVEFP